MASSTRVGLLAIVFYPDGGRVNSWGTGPVVENYFESIVPPNPSMVFGNEPGATFGILVAPDDLDAHGEVALDPELQSGKGCSSHSWDSKAFDQIV